MIKRDEMSSSQSCLNKAAEDEPLFVLRSSDKLAPVIVRMWALLAAMLGTGALKVNEAYECADKMERWAKEHGGGKYPD